MRRTLIFASAAAAVFASVGCQQAWEGFKRFEARKFQTLFGESPDQCEPAMVMPASAPVVYQPSVSYAQPSMTYAPSAVASPSACAACGSGTTITTAPATVLPQGTTVVPGVTTSPGPIQ
jgi:hypothetical protein